TTCTGCRTLAVALQLGLASANAAHVGPKNVAVATNAACADCVTIAKAVQVFYTVDDPTKIPPALADAVRGFDREMVAISSDRSLTLTDAEARVDALIARFIATAVAYDQQRQLAR